MQLTLNQTDTVKFTTVKKEKLKTFAQSKHIFNSLYTDKQNSSFLWPIYDS